MTTIAVRIYADRVELAADRRVMWTESTSRALPDGKLRELWGCPAAFCGSGQLIVEFCAWAEARSAPDWREAGLNSELRAFLKHCKEQAIEDRVLAGGRALIALPGLRFVDCSIQGAHARIYSRVGDYEADGSGSPYAIGAMAFDASPLQAVECAAMHDAATGDGVDTAVVPREVAP